MESQSVNTLVLVALLLQSLGEDQRALEVLRLAQRQFPEDLVVNIRLSMALAAQGPSEMREAIRYFTAAVALRPQNSRIRYGLAVVFSQNGESEQAVAELSEAIRLDPLYGMARLSLGGELKRLGRLDEAITALRVGLELQPEHAPGHAQLGVAFARSGDGKNAAAEYRTALDLDPQNALALAGLGRLASERGDLEVAVGFLRSAIRAEPESATYHQNLGHALRLRGDHPAALPELRRSLELDPEGSSLVFIDLAHVLEALVDCPGALQAQLEVVRRTPEEAVGWNNLAWFLVTCVDETVRDPEAAVGYARKALAMASDSGLYWNTLGLALLRAANYSTSLEAFERSTSLRKGGDPYDWLFMAICYERLRQHETAMHWYRQALQWMDAQAVRDARMERFRIEAAQVLLGTENRVDGDPR